MNANGTSSTGQPAATDALRGKITILELAAERERYYTAALKPITPLLLDAPRIQHNGQTVAVISVDTLLDLIGVIKGHRALYSMQLHDQARPQSHHELLDVYWQQRTHRQ